MLPADKHLPSFLPALDTGTVGRLLAAALIPRHIGAGDLKVERFSCCARKRAVILYRAELYDSRSERSPHVAVMHEENASPEWLVCQ
jgi:hypothetical protein